MSAATPRRTSSRSRSTSTCTTAGAWTTRACRRSICSSPCEPDVAVPALLEALGAGQSRIWCRHRKSEPFKPAGDKLAVDISPTCCAARSATGLPRSPTSRCPGTAPVWPFRHPLDYLGSDGGGGVGGGPGISVGAALALKGTGRLPIAVCGDGDFMMGVHRDLDRGALPHSAADRGRQQSLLLQRRAAPGACRPHAQPPGRQQLDRPAHLRSGHRHRQHGARAGRAGLRPGRHAIAELEAALAKAIAVVEDGGVAVVDVRVEPGYTAGDDRGDDPQERLARDGRSARASSAMPSWWSTTSSSVSRRRTVSLTAVDDVSFTVTPGRIPLGDRAVRLRQVHAVQRHRRAARRLRGPRQRRRRDRSRPAPSIGMIFQEESTFPWRTVIDNVAFPLEIAGMAKASALERPAISSSWSASTASSTAIRPNCPAACASACRWRARSPPSRKSC